MNIKTITRMLLLAALLLGLMVLVAPLVPTAASQQPTKEQGTFLSTKASPTAFYGTFARKSSGRIDIARTLNSVRSHGAHGFQFLVANRWGHNSSQDWADLPAFLDAARAWHVDVDVILLPPTEASPPLAGQWQGTCSSGKYPPFYGSYDRWYTEIGKLAHTHPALVGSGIDDYPLSVGSYCKSFKSSDAVRWQRLQDVAAGRHLRFLPTVYFCHVAPGWQNLVKGGKLSYINFAYTDSGNGPAKIKGQIAAIHKLYPNLKMVVMVFASPPAHQNRKPTASTVDEEVRAALSVGSKGGVAGVVVYGQALR